jgi:hypothetical protein
MGNILLTQYKHLFFFQVSPNWDAYLKLRSEGQMKWYKSEVSL